METTHELQRYDLARLHSIYKNEVEHLKEAFEAEAQLGTQFEETFARIQGQLSGVFYYVSWQPIGCRRALT